MFNLVNIPLCLALLLCLSSLGHTQSVPAMNEESTRAVLKIAFADVDSFPFEYMKGDEFVGIHPEMISAVADQQGFDVEFYRLPWKRILSMIENGELDAVSFIGGYRNSHDATWFYGGNALTINGFYLMTLNDRKDIKYKGDLGVLKPLKIVSLRGYHFLEWERNILNLQDRLDVVEVDTKEQMEQMLLRGRVDVAVVMRSTLEKKRRGNLNDFRVVSRPLNSVYVYLGFSKHNFEFPVVEKFGDAMREFQNTTEFSRIQKHYKNEIVPVELSD
jgi:polar amino acid transport system substrate-binding protein